MDKILDGLPQKVRVKTRGGRQEVRDEAQPLSVPEDLPTHSEDGVDLTLIRWMLAMTPAERLRTLQRTVQSILRLRRGNAGN
ncbi:MAG: hypothetical protein ACRD3O_18440 [Terriglobia bacterium]